MGLKFWLTATAILTAATAFAATVAFSPPQIPDHTLTPGAIDPHATLQMICVDGYTAQPGVRHVTASTKRKVFTEYGINPKVDGPYEVDHLISLELGGSNDIKNLWPQSYASEPLNAHVKDALEDRLHRLVCQGQVPLAQAQKDIASDWREAFQKYVGALPN